MEAGGRTPGGGHGIQQRPLPEPPKPVTIPYSKLVVDFKKKPLGVVSMKLYRLNMHPQDPSTPRIERLKSIYLTINYIFSNCV